MSLKQLLRVSQSFAERRPIRISYFDPVKAKLRVCPFGVLGAARLAAIQAGPVVVKARHCNVHKTELG